MRYVRCETHTTRGEGEGIDEIRRAEKNRSFLDDSEGTPPRNTLEMLRKRKMGYNELESKDRGMLQY